MSFAGFLGAFEQGLIFAILAMGVFISFRLLNMADMTADGSFVSGMAVSVGMTLFGRVFLALPLAFFVAGIAGIFTGFLHTKLKISSILSGILTMTGLYSINFRLMSNKPNLALIGNETIFTKFPQVAGGRYSSIILLFSMVFLVGLALYVFLGTQLGLCLIATGDNEDMVRASSIDVDKMKMMGLFLANALVGLSGGVYGQYMQFADISGGTGMMVIGVASIIVGETLFSFEKLSTRLFAICVGAVVYRVLLMLAMGFGLKASDLKLVSALLVVVVISAPIVKDKMMKKRST